MSLQSLNALFHSYNKYGFKKKQKNKEQGGDTPCTEKPQTMSSYKEHKQVFAHIVTKTFLLLSAARQCLLH